MDKVTLSDFRSSLARLKETDSDYTIVGGLAVGQWGEALLTPDERRSFSLPIRSKDIDIRASKDVTMMLLRNLKEEGAIPSTIVKRIPKDPRMSFPSVAIPVRLIREKGELRTTVEGLTGLPLLDQQTPLGIKWYGSRIPYGDLYLLDPCSLLVCKLNALHTRPPGESGNDKVHAEILSLVIPRFIAKALHRHREQGDPYHPGADATHMLSFLERDPWDALLPPEQKNAVVDACEQFRPKAPDDVGTPG